MATVSSDRVFAVSIRVEVLTGSHVKWFTDNQAAVKIVEMGSMTLELQKMAISIFNICIDHSITLDIQWIPREMNTSTYSLKKGALSYTRGREIFQQSLTQLGYQAKDYGLHSLRSGGITAVVQNSNNTVPERIRKLHGRWKTDTAKDMYVQESLAKRLEFSDYLGL